MKNLLFLVVSLLASTVGSICGIGGGIIIKPVLDLLGLASVPAISFLSGCAVLSMSCYSVGKGLLAGDGGVELRSGTPLAIGAAAGGVAGKQMFTAIKGLFANPNGVGAVQAACLTVITLGTLLYTLKRKGISTHRISSPVLCGVIGLALGICSSFLGIGGGPINLVALGFFFSMETKTAAANSLYIILFSQAASLLMTIATHTVPEFELTALLLMVLGGILGGAAGRQFNRRLSGPAVDKLFVTLMAVIICISIYNTWQYMAV